ncbi:MAG: hypothetical protein KGL39_09610 [Patescibacteria group bacterium]|nr:hypothetical protein [Patescibacteria group bacterium]
MTRKDFLFLSGAMRNAHRAACMAGERMPDEFATVYTRGVELAATELANALRAAAGPSFDVARFLRDAEVRP